MMILSTDTTYLSICYLFILLTAIVHIFEMATLRQIIKKHNLEYELDATNEFLHIETAFALTIWTFLICHYIKLFLRHNSILPYALLGTIAGIIIGLIVSYIIVYFMGKRIRKRVNK